MSSHISSKRPPGRSPNKRNAPDVVLPGALRTGLRDRVDRCSGMRIREELTSGDRSKLLFSWFRSTPPRGGGLQNAARAMNLRPFQSTPPRGGDGIHAKRLQQQRKVEALRAFTQKHPQLADRNCHAGKFLHDFKELALVRTTWVFCARLWFAPFRRNRCQTISVPPRSVAGLAPMCSTFRCQLAPR